MELTAPQRDSLDALLVRDALAIARARAHLYAVLPPDDCGTWDVDLAAPLFTERVGANVHLSGPVQLIATWSRSDETWLWADHNPSIAPAGTATIMAALREHPEVADLRAVPRFSIAQDAAEQLATWCAVKAGWMGAWPGATGSAIALLALQPTIYPGNPGAETARQWCTMCGKTRREIATLLAGPGVNLCNECVDMLSMIAEESTSKDPALFMPPCLFCGKYQPRVFGRTGAVCHECVGHCARSLGAGGR